MSKLIYLTRNAEIGGMVFSSPPIISRDISDDEARQFIAIIGSLQEIIYCFERVDEASAQTFPYAAPVRFYVNSIFHYVSALFLLDYKKNKKLGFPRPGTVIKVLHPLELKILLDPR